MGIACSHGHFMGGNLEKKKSVFLRTSKWVFSEKPRTRKTVGSKTVRRATVIVKRKRKDIKKGRRGRLIKWEN